MSLSLPSTAVLAIAPNATQQIIDDATEEDVAFVAITPDSEGGSSTDSHGNTADPASSSVHRWVSTSGRNSAFSTLPTSNVRGTKDDEEDEHYESENEHENNDGRPPRRKIFGNARYPDQYYYSTSSIAAIAVDYNNNNNNTEDDGVLDITSSSFASLDTAYQITATPRNESRVSTLTLDGSSANHIDYDDEDDNDDKDALLRPPQHYNNDSTPSSRNRQSRRDHRKRRKRYHETIHAQSLLIGLTFLCIWSPSNLMAPHLTDMSIFFGWGDSEASRDLYLGSYVAIVTGVLSLPLAAALGFLADVAPRRYLFAATAWLTATASLATANQVETYKQLLWWRWLQGAGMGGSVPIAFSLLSDLFPIHERNTASSGLTAMMGLGIILGQVGAGMHVGYAPGTNWQFPFAVSGAATAVMAVLSFAAVQEPVRGGQEKALQDMIKSGTRYERQLSWEGFWHACLFNASNVLLLWQGFFSSLPWGVIFVFLNDYLSQERGFSIPDATYLVLVFGVGCAVGGILGGAWGQWVQARDRSYLPLFMGTTTLAGMLPFWGLLNSHTTNAHGWTAFGSCFLGGLVASLPAVNVRPCLMNVNPPETRGASLTAANLLINIGRGLGPSCVTLLGSVAGIDRRGAFNWTISVFWTISAIQLFLLAGTLPRDQDKMEAELALYAEEALQKHREQLQFRPTTPQEEKAILTNSDRLHEEAELVPLGEGMNTFDGRAARETLMYVRKGVEELNNVLPFHRCGSGGRRGSVPPGETGSSSSSSNDDEDHVSLKIQRRLWQQHRKEKMTGSHPSEDTPLIV